MDILQKTIPYGFSFIQADNTPASIILPREGIDGEVYRWLFYFCESINKRKDRITNWGEFFKAIFPGHEFPSFSSSSNLSTPGCSNSETGEDGKHYREFFWYISRLGGNEILYAISRISPNKPRKSKSVQSVQRMGTLGSCATNETEKGETCTDAGLVRTEGDNSTCTGKSGNAKAGGSSGMLAERSTEELAPGYTVFEGKSGLQVRIRSPKTSRATILPDESDPNVENMGKETKPGAKRKRTRKSPIAGGGLPGNTSNTTNTTGNTGDAIGVGSVNKQQEEGEIINDERTVEVMDINGDDNLKWLSLDDVKKFTGMYERIIDPTRVLKSKKNMQGYRDEVKEALLFYRMNFSLFTDRDFPSKQMWIDMQKIKHDLEERLVKMVVGSK
jgi:hypothetical protein